MLAVYASVSSAFDAERFLPAHDYALSPAQRRLFPGGRPQPGTGSRVTITPLVNRQRNIQSKRYSPEPELTRTARSDWEILESIQAIQEFPFHWKTHRGTAEESVAQVRVQRPDGTQSYTALVVRCDGFLMAPQAVWDAVKEKLPVEVVVSGAEGEESRGPFPITLRNPLKSRQKDYHFVKVNGHHLRSLPVLAPWNLKKDTPVRLIWTAIGEDKTLKTQSVVATCEEPPADRKSAYCDLRFAPGQAPARVPDGTVVVDAASGAALGMITEGSQPTRFATTRFFGDLCAEVALAPDRDAAQAKTPRDTQMVKVDGGAVIYDNKEFVNHYKTVIACTPDFYCDKYLVTVGEWMEYLKTHPDRPLPNGWDALNQNNPPTRRPKLPVSGITGGDMRDYAAMRQKRMLTPVEWILAAKTTHTEWLDRQEEQIDGIKTAIEKSHQSYQNAIKARGIAAAQLAQNLTTANQNLTANVSRATGQSFAGPLTSPLPPIVFPDLTASYIEELGSVRTQMTAGMPYIPGQPHEVGTMSEDKSDLGLFDVLMNVPEACLSFGANYLLAPKLRPAGQDPYTSKVFYMLIPSLGVPGSAPSPSATANSVHGTIASSGIEDPRFWAAVWKSQLGGVYSEQPYLETTLIGGFYIVQIDAVCGAGFRCAR